MAYDKQAFVLFPLNQHTSTTEISKKQQPEGLEENKIVAQKGGNAAKQARLEIEKQTGESIVSSSNAKPHANSADVKGDALSTSARLGNHLSKGLEDE